MGISDNTEVFLWQFLCVCFIIEKQFMGAEFIGTYSLYFQWSLQY